MQLVAIFMLSWASGEPKPFWQAKEKIHARIVEREVIVSVKSVQKKLIVAGGGRVHAPVDFTYNRALEFERLPEVSDVVRSSRFDAKTKRLDLGLSAYGYSTTMRLEIEATPLKIAYRMLTGPLKGMTGAFRFFDVPPARTEVGMDGELEYDELPLPRFFLTFGMEVVFQRLAVSLREHVEREFKKEKSK